VTSAEALEQAEAVEKILEDLEILDLPVIKVFNKIDLLSEEEKNELLRGNKPEDSSPFYLSAKTGEGVEVLKKRLRSTLFKNFQSFRLRIPRARVELINSLARQVIIIKKTEIGEGWEYQVMAERDILFPYLSYLEKGERL
jgi:GTP-binding protein HflX